jgi:ribosome biogenesis protein SSF1/2
VVLIHLDPETNLISLRHFVVDASPVGLTKSIKKIIKGKVPDLGNRVDIADYVMDPGQLSDSEVEDTPETRVTLAQSLPGRGNVAKEKSALRLKELGPRLTLSLIKIEQEMSGGQVLYHALKSKTPEEIEELRARKVKEKKLKLQRKKIQEDNVKHKKAEVKAAKKAAGVEVSDDEVEEPKSGITNDEDVDDDDYQWYKQEVGSAPESGLFGDRMKRGREGKEKQNRPQKQPKNDATSGPEKHLSRGEKKKAFGGDKKKGFGGKFKKAGPKS